MLEERGITDLPQGLQGPRHHQGMFVVQQPHDLADRPGVSPLAQFTDRLVPLVEIAALRVRRRPGARGKEEEPPQDP